MTCKPGLRDRKKAATRAALSDAAAQLARRDGIDAVTAEAIASEAGVSTRTFHNYFSSKEEAVLSHFETAVIEWMGLLRQRPSDEPIWDSLESTVIAIVTDPKGQLQDSFTMLELVDSTPTLLAKKVNMHLRVTRMLAEVIAERTGTNADTDLYPNLLHMMVGAACKTAMDLWFTGRTDASGPDELVRDAFRQLRAGLPEPDRN